MPHVYAACTPCSTTKSAWLSVFFVANQKTAGCAQHDYWCEHYQYVGPCVIMDANFIEMLCLTWSLMWSFSRCDQLTASTSPDNTVMLVFLAKNGVVQQPGACVCLSGRSGWCSAQGRSDVVSWTGENLFTSDVKTWQNFLPSWKFFYNNSSLNSAFLIVWLSLWQGPLKRCHVHTKIVGKAEWFRLIPGEGRDTNILFCRQRHGGNFSPKSVWCICNEICTFKYPQLSGDTRVLQ